MRTYLLAGCLVALVTGLLAAQVRIQVRPAKAPGTTPDQPVVDEAKADKKALDAASLNPEDADALLGYIKQRTLSDSDLSKIQAVIRRLGADDFEERLKAAQEVERFGPAAVGPLRMAAQAADADPEVSYRAGECLRRMEKVPHAAVAAAAVRALAKLKPADTAKVLLAFLPLSDDPSVTEQIRKTLVAVAVRGNKADPALVEALSDPMPIRRATAAMALIEGGPTTERIRIPDAYSKVLEAAKTEKDIETRFQMLYPLLTVAREKSAVSQIIELIPDLPRGRLWQAEDFLLQLAGSAAPKAVLGRTKESLVKAKDAWNGWWTTASEKTDLAAFQYTPRIQGKTLLVLMDFRYGSTGAIVELGPDLKETWRIPGLGNPMDAQMMPDGNVLIAEHNSNRITIRDTRGRVKETRTIGGANRIYGNPQQVQLLENGNILVICRNVIVEFKKDKDEEVMRYVRQQYDISAGLRLPNGETMIMLQNGPDHCIFLDDKGKDIADKKLKIGMPFYQAHAADAGKDRVLITELNQVVEYDLKKGEKVWSKAVNQPRSVQRLPNGNTLFSDATANRIVEVTPDGEEVWTYQPANGLQVFRGYRR